MLLSDHAPGYRNPITSHTQLTAGKQAGFQPPRPGASRVRSFDQSAGRAGATGPFLTRPGQKWPGNFPL